MGSRVCERADTTTLVLLRCRPFFDLDNIVEYVGLHGLFHFYVFGALDHVGELWTVRGVVVLAAFTDQYLVLVLVDGFEHDVSLG